VLTEHLFKISVKVEEEELVALVSMALEELPVTQLQPEDEVLIILEIPQSMAQQTFRVTTQVVDRNRLYLEARVVPKQLP
jgi:hypothetical protein